MSDFNNLSDADDGNYDEFTGEKMPMIEHYSISVSSDSDNPTEVNDVDHGCSSKDFYSTQLPQSSIESSAEEMSDSDDVDLIALYSDENHKPVDIKNVCFFACTLTQLATGDAFFEFAKNSQNKSTATELSSNSENSMRLYSSNVRKYLSANPKKPQKVSEVYASWTKEQFSDHFKHRMENLKSTFTMNSNVKPAMNKFFEFILSVAKEDCPNYGCRCRFRMKEMQRNTTFCKYCGCGCQPREEDLNTAKYICCHNSDDECFSNLRPNLLQCNDCNKIFGACMFNQYLFDMMTGKPSYRSGKYMQCNLCYKNYKPKRILSRRKGVQTVKSKIRCGDTVRLRYDLAWRRQLLIGFDTNTSKQYLDILNKGVEYSCLKMKFPKNMDGHFNYMVEDQSFTFDCFVRRNGQYMIGDFIKIQKDSKVYIIAGCTEGTVDVYEHDRTDSDRYQSYTFSRHIIEGLYCTKKELTFDAKKKAVFNFQAYEAKNLKQVMSLVQNDLQKWNLQKFVALNSFTKADDTMAFDKLKNYKRSLVLKKRELQKQYKKWKCDLLEKLELLSANNNKEALAYVKRYISLKHKCDVNQICRLRNKKKIAILVKKHVDSRKQRRILEFNKKRKKGVLTYSYGKWFRRIKNQSVCRQVINMVLKKVPVFSMCRNIVSTMVEESMEISNESDVESDISVEDFLN